MNKNPARLEVKGSEAKPNASTLQSLVRYLEYLTPSCARKPNQGRKMETDAENLSPDLARALDRLVAAGSKDLGTARVVLGFIALISGERSQEFPGYVPQILELNEVSDEQVRADLATLLKSAANGEGGLAAWHFYTPRDRLVARVNELRARSPIGKKLRARAKAIARRFPPLDVRKSMGETEDGTELITLFPDEEGQPLSERVVFRVAGLNPPRLQVLPHNAYWEIYSSAGDMTIRLKADGFSIKYISQMISVPTRKKIPARRVEGKLFDFFETGAEGVLWAIKNDRYSGYDGLDFIQKGDLLTVFDQLGKKIWRGVICPNQKIGWREYPKYPGHGQPCALGHWVHWTQEGFTADDWARFFIRPDYDRYWGRLVKAASQVDRNEGTSS